LFDQLRRVLKRLLERIEQTAIRKRIGRDIDDTHHERTVMGGANEFLLWRQMRCIPVSGAPIKKAGIIPAFLGFVIKWQPE
jgi:hypothetical protein